MLIKLSYQKVAWALHRAMFPTRPAPVWVSSNLLKQNWLLKSKRRNGKRKITHCRAQIANVGKWLPPPTWSTNLRRCVSSARGKYVVWLRHFFELYCAGSWPYGCETYEDGFGKDQPCIQKSKSPSHLPSRSRLVNGDQSKGWWTVHHYSSKPSTLLVIIPISSLPFIS